VEAKGRALLVAAESPLTVEKGILSKGHVTNVHALHGSRKFFRGDHDDYIVYGSILPPNYLYQDNFFEKKIV
jgi:hypothetical protein